MQHDQYLKPFLEKHHLVMSQTFRKQRCPGLQQGADRSVSVCQGQAVAVTQREHEPTQRTKLNNLN